MNHILKKLNRSILFMLLCISCVCGCGKSDVTFISTDETVSDKAQGFNESQGLDNVKETDKTQTVNNLQESESMQADTGESSSDNPIQNANIYVFVCGEVNTPGVYELKNGARLYEAIELAGGFTSEACGEAWNQAAVLLDGQQIYVPSAEQFEGQDSRIYNEAFNASKAGEQAESSGLVNINTATKEELCTLPGVGESRALDIIAYREQKGKFTDISDIKNVSGIKDGLFSKIKDMITV